MRRKPKTYTLKQSVIDALELESNKQGRTKSQIVERVLERELLKERGQSDPNASI